VSLFCINNIRKLKFYFIFMRFVSLCFSFLYVNDIYYCFHVLGGHGTMIALICGEKILNGKKIAFQVRGLKIGFLETKNRVVKLK